MLSSEREAKIFIGGGESISYNLVGNRRQIRLIIQTVPLALPSLRDLRRLRMTRLWVRAYIRIENMLGKMVKANSVMICETGHCHNVWVV